MALDANINFQNYQTQTQSYGMSNYGVCKNPFLNDKKLESCDNINVRKVLNATLYKKFSKLFIICLKPFSNFKKEIYNAEISREIEDYIENNYILYEVPLYIINTDEIKNNLVLLADNFIKKINPIGYELGDLNLCVLFLNLKLDNVKLFISQFKPEYALNDYFALKIMNDYYNTSQNFYTFSKAKKILQNINGANFWNNPKNCNLNQTISFCNRKWNFTAFYKLENSNAKDVIKELRDSPVERNNYLSWIYDKKAYWTLSEEVRKKGFSRYKINDNVNEYTPEIFNELFKKIKAPQEKELFLLLLLKNRKYCGIILKSQVLKFFTLLSDTQLICFETYFKYAWFTMAIEESITKSQTTKDSRFVFTLNQVQNFPIWNNRMDNILDNPYITFLVSQKAIDINNNLLPVQFNKGVVTMEQYKKRLNLFITGNHELNIFKDFGNWEKFAVTGSVNAAIIPKSNGILENYFEKNNKLTFESLDKYFDTYYTNSDLDIINLADSWPEFFKNTKELIDIIDKNTNETSYVKFEKTACIVINENFIKNYIHPNVSCDYDDLILMINKDIELKKHVYKYYLNFQLIENEKNIQKEFFTNEFYNSLFDIIDIDNVMILIKKTQQDWDKFLKDKDLENNFTGSIKYNNDKIYTLKKENCLCNINLNLKMKVSNPKIKRNLEIFRSRVKSFFPMITKFHLGPVRSMYQGPIKDKPSQVYMLPSAITAYMTGMCLNKQYFSGKDDPCAIVHKYHRRGYGLILNKKEIIHFIQYCFKMEKYRALYGMENLRDINKIIGSPENKLIFSPQGKIKYKLQNTNTNVHKYRLVTTKSIIDNCGYVIPLTI